MLGALALAAALSNVGGHPIVFPCRPGKVLTYQANGRWEEGAGPSTIIKRTLTWHTRFIRCSTNSSKAVAIVRGLPLDLAWYQLGEKPNTYAIIQTANGIFIQRLARNPKLDLQAIIPSPDDQYIGFPVQRGTCAKRRAFRPDRSYCWLVESTQDSTGRMAWAIVYMTRPDYTRLSIVPGIGITSFSYHHNGTVEEVKVNLVHATK